MNVFCICVICLFASCVHKTTDFTIIDYAENAMNSSVETIFQRYGFDLEKADIVSEDTKKGTVAYTPVEKIIFDNKEATLTFFVTSNEPIQLRYRVSFDETDDHLSIYDALIEQSRYLQDQQNTLCKYEQIDGSYTKYPQDTFATQEEFYDRVKGEAVYSTFWVWLLDGLAEDERIWSDLFIWYPVDQPENAYLEYRLYLL